MIRIGIKALWLAMLLFSVAFSRAEMAVLPLESRVIDLTATLSISEVTRLEQKLSIFEKKKGSQIAVLIVPTTRPETIEQYAIRVAEAWKLGRKGIDDGVLLLIAKNDRTLRIEVGYGLEGVLPDAMVKRIIEEIIVPPLKKGKFAEGIDAGIGAVLKLIEGEVLPRPHLMPDDNSADRMNLFLDNFIAVVMGFTVLGKILQVLLGRLVGATVTSIAVGLAGWLFFSSVVMAILMAVFIFCLGLFQGAGRGIYRNGRRNGHWPGSHGIGGGGFRGGGGGFGGGGASGRW